MNAFIHVKGAAAAQTHNTRMPALSPIPVARPPFGIEDFLAHLPLFREIDRPALKRSRAAPSRSTRRAARCCSAAATAAAGEKVIELMGAGQSFGETVMFSTGPTQ